MNDVADTLALERFLNQLRLPPSGQGVTPSYIIGCFERRVTLFSQQVRALNLVYSLFRTKRLSVDERVAIVGAGAAGITAAAAILKLGGQVTLIDRQSEPLSNLRGCAKRWIHPHIYDWPEVGAENPDAGLPLMNWRADYADKVRGTLLQQWVETVEGSASRLTWAANAELENLVLDRYPRVGWVSPSKQQASDRFQAVILAVGFGLERSHKKLRSISYWADDDLEQLHLKRTSPGETFRVLVSGSGDGGLIDCQRVRLSDFHHDKLTELVSTGNPAEVRQLREDLLAIDRNEKSSDPEWMTDQYKRLRVPSPMEDAIAKRLLGGTNLVLHTREGNWLSKSASILNRFLVHRISQHGNFRHLSGEIETVKEISEDRWRIKLRQHEPLEVNRVVIRHGPSSEIDKEPLLSVVKPNKEYFSALSVLDDTFRPLWTGHEEFFTVAPAVRHQGSTEDSKPECKRESTIGNVSHATISFEDICRPSIESIETAIANCHSIEVNIVWHPQIRGAEYEVESMYLDLDARIEKCMSAGPERSTDHLQRLRNEFFNLREGLRNCTKAIEVSWKLLLNCTFEENLQNKRLAVRSFTGLAALRMVSFLSSFANMIIDSEGREVVQIFADLGGARPLIYTFPYLDSLASGALHLSGPRSSAEFLQCRVGPPATGGYEYVHLPRINAELSIWQPIDDGKYFAWVLPQWLLLYGTVPPKGVVILMAKDAFGHEFWKQSDKPEWYLEKSREPEHKKIILGYNGLHDVKLIHQSVPPCDNCPGGVWKYIAASFAKT